MSREKLFICVFQGQGSFPGGHPQSDDSRTADGWTDVGVSVRCDDMDIVESGGEKKLESSKVGK